MPLLDLHDQIQVTEYVRREYDAIARSAGGGEDRSTGIVRRILPLKPHEGRHVRMRITDVLGVGLAQLKAPGARPALWNAKPNLRDQLMELVDIDEAHRYDPIEMMALKSSDPNYRREAKYDFTQYATMLAQRNDQRTDWLMWEALKGVMVLNYPNGGTQTVGTGIPASHFPTFMTPWTTIATSNPIEDLFALGAVGLSDAGIYLDHHHMSEATYRYMQRSAKVIAALSTYGRDVMLPTTGDLQQLLREGTVITRTDDGWLSENSPTPTLNKWIADGKIFTTTKDYTYAGRRLGWTADGWVLVGSASTADQPVAKQGIQSEWIYDRHSQNTTYRQASARMPILEAPNAIAWGTAY